MPAAAVLVAAGMSSAAARSPPSGASVAYGSVGFQRSSATLTINQSSQAAISDRSGGSILGGAVNVLGTLNVGGRHGRGGTVAITGLSIGFAGAAVDAWGPRAAAPSTSAAGGRGRGRCRTAARC